MRLNYEEEEVKENERVFEACSTLSLSPANGLHANKIMNTTTMKRTMFNTMYENPFKIEHSSNLNESFEQQC